MDIAFNVNNAYAHQLSVCIYSILKHNKGPISFYVFSNDFSDENKRNINKLKLFFKNWDITYLSPDPKLFSNLRLNVPHISRETYYRFVMPDMLPHVDKLLYLDVDLIVCKSLEKLWNTDIRNYYCAGVQDLWIQTNESYGKKIGLKSTAQYINAGVLLINAKKWRMEGVSAKCFQIAREQAHNIQWQDQDVINICCNLHIKLLDSAFNFTSKNISEEIKKASNAVIVHYTGCDKPWNPNYKVKFFSSKRKIKLLWQKYNREYNKLKEYKIKGALLVNEFFGGAKTAYGGYGFLARNYIAKFLPTKDIQLDVILGRSESKFFLRKEKIDNIYAIFLPCKKIFSQICLWFLNYKFYLTIEVTDDWVLKCLNGFIKAPVLFWIQDPRTKKDWEEIESVKLLPEQTYWAPKTYSLISDLTKQGKIVFFSQAQYLIEKARELYNLPSSVNISFLPNPIVCPTEEIDVVNKKNWIIFLGRVEDVKRGWLFCEIAKCCPEYDFYVLGASWRNTRQNSSVLERYKDIKNLHFVGHVEGEEKKRYLKDAKILLNTSIHEALPISFLEALSYGTVLVSNQNPDDLTSKFGIFVGKVLGDGFDAVPLYVQAIKKLMNDDSRRVKCAQEGITYIRNIHSVQKWILNLDRIIWESLK